MHPTGEPAFYEALSTMADYFGDPLSDTRLDVYWRQFGEKVTLAEWQNACEQAMERETFHKVPLAAKLWEYINAYRLAQREQDEAERARMDHAQRLLKAPEWQAEQRRLANEQMDRDEAISAQRQGVRASSPSGTLKPLIETLPVTYDPIARQAFLREQLQQMLTEEPHAHETA